MLRPGLDSGGVIERFELERQALALMDHPCVARVFDAGATDEGRPFFVMELVDGESLTEFCERHELTLEQRLELFRDVCSAVQHAHQRGIIHRDLKPSNVLVTRVDGRPMPKVIDFGIAKAIHGRLERATALTELRQVVGTLEYMSPEQATLGDSEVDTRSDIYSLGVVLYELLTGAPPFDRRQLDRASVEEALRVVREVDPERPSTRVRTRASGEGATTTLSRRGELSLARRLRGDLDWIVLKALEKDRDRRYESAGALAADLERHLDNMPVEAGPPSRVYRLRKFYRRHRIGVLAAAAVVLALVAGLVVSMLALRRAATERDRALAARGLATREAESARQVSDFLVELFEVSDPEYALGREVSAREILDRGAVRIEGLVDDQPRVGARLLTVLGSVYSSLGLYDEAESRLVRAAELSADAGDGVTHASALDNRLQLASLRVLQNRLAEAEELATTSLAERRSRFGDRSLEAAEALTVLGEIGYRGSDTTHSDLIEEALDIRRELLGDSHPAIAESLSGLAQKAAWFNDFDTASKLYREALQMLEADLDRLHPRVIATQSQLVWSLAYLRQAEEALPLADDSIARTVEVYGQQHPAVGDAYANRGTVHYRATRDYEAALGDFETAIAILQLTWRPTHPKVTEIRRRRAFALVSLERFDDALAQHFAVLEADIENLGADHNMVARQYYNIGEAARRKGDHALAADYIRRHLDQTNPGLDWRNDVRYARPMNTLALSLTALRRFDEAEGLLLDAHRLLTEEYGAEHWTTKLQVDSLVDLYRAWQRQDELEKWSEELARIESEEERQDESGNAGENED